MTQQGIAPNWTHPAHFGNPESEYVALSQDKVCIDLPEHRSLIIKGADAVSFLQGLLTTNVRKLAVGAASPSWLLSASGKIQVHLQLFKRDEHTLIAQTLADDMDQLKTRLDKYLIMEDASLEPFHSAHVSIQGPNAEAWLQDHPELQAIPNNRSGFGGFDLLGDKDSLRPALESLTACGFHALHQARTQAFIPLYGIDMVADVNPLIYGKLESTISYTKGCFVGQETVARSRDRGTPPHLLVQLKSNAPTPPAAQTELTNPDGKAIGHITSATLLADGCACAFARIKYAEAQLEAKLQDTHGTTWKITALSNVKGS